MIAKVAAAHCWTPTADGRKTVWVRSDSDRAEQRLADPPALPKPRGEATVVQAIGRGDALPSAPGPLPSPDPGAAANAEDHVGGGGAAGCCG